jgi:hypothetical protein
MYIIFNTPTLRVVKGSKAHLLNQVKVLGLPKGLGQHISNHSLSRHILELNHLSLHSFTNEMVLHINVLGPRVVGGILGQSNGPLVVTQDLCAPLLHKANISQELP